MAVFRFCVHLVEINVVPHLSLQGGLKNRNFWQKELIHRKNNSNFAKTLDFKPIFETSSKVNRGYSVNTI